MIDMIRPALFRIAKKYENWEKEKKTPCMTDFFDFSLLYFLRSIVDLVVINYNISNLRVDAPI